MILSIDFGGTRTRVGWFSDALDLLARDEGESHTEESQDAVIARIIALAKKVVPPGETPRAIGICGPGPQAYTGLILNAATLPGWDRVPLAARISEAFGGAPAHMENDANLAALAEYHFGAARGANPAIYLTVSTGIGGGAIIDGKLFTGWRGLAIEPGHLKFPAPNGKLYSLEAFSSGTGIGRLARERLERGDEPSSLRDVPVVDGKAVGEAAAAGDAFALSVVEQAGRWLGLGLVNLVHLFNPQVIVIGGSVVNLGELIFAPALQVLADNLIDPLFNDADLVRVAELGDDVCLIGAALHAQAKLSELRA
jgi:glucokinase